MTRFSKVRAVRTIIDGFQDETHSLLNHFISHTRNAQPPHLTVRLRYEGGPYRLEPEPFGLHFFNYPFNCLHPVAIKGLLIDPWCHFCQLTLDPQICDAVPLPACAQH